MLTSGNRMESYFNNMTTFTLFKPYKIEEKLSRMQSVTEVEALVAAIFAFAARFHSSFSTLSRPTECPPHSHFACIASKRLNEALEQLDDAVAPLWLLQANILLTFYQLTQSVRSKSWRHLGVCIRLAYELDLHRVDFPPNQPLDRDKHSIDTEHWSMLEEKRRAWWAIWEMDVLASAIRRLPMAINWGYNFTFLPVPDSNWFGDSPQKSCYLAMDPNLRCKHLQESGNLSPKAWYIVINSFVQNCQLLLSDYKVNTGSTINMADVTILANCLYCTTNSPPSDLTYHGQALDFVTRRSPQDISYRQFHNDIYCIHIMTQLVHFMILHHQIAVEAPWMDESDTKNLKTGDENKISNHPLWSNYMKVSEDVITMVRNSSGEHYKYVNPFMINTLWIAAAAQIACRIFGPLSFNRQLAESNYELLCLNMDRSIIFRCGMDILKRRLIRVEALLKGLAARQGNDRSTINLAGFTTSGMMTSNHDASVTDSSNVSDSQAHPPMNSNMQSLMPLLDSSMEPHISIDYIDFFASIEQFFPYDAYDS
ncbi:fungal-specific transcription factor domain-containing protein [Trichoderma pleuroticola]